MTEQTDGLIFVNEADGTRTPLVLQTIIISKSLHSKMDAAREEASKFAHGSGMKSGDETEESFRFRVRDPGDFVEGSFRTIKPKDGVSLVLGKLKQ